jgi:O-antigen/teichoic acid export membrane protein
VKQAADLHTGTSESSSTRAGGSPPFPGRASLLRGASSALILQVLGVVLAYALHVTLARWMGAGGYGTYAYVISWATVLATVGALGLPLASLRFVSQHTAGERWPELKGVLLGAPALVLLGGGAVFVVGAAWATLVMSDPVLWIFGFACVPFIAQLTLGTEIGRGLGSITAALTPSRILRPLLILMTVALVWDKASSPTLALAATLAALVGSTIVQVIWLCRLAPLSVGAVPGNYQPRRWLTTAFPMMIATGAALLLTQLDLLMVGLLLDDEAVGLYSAAAKTAAIIPLVLYALNMVAAPGFAALYDRGDAMRLQELATAVARWAFWPSLALAALLALASGWILSLFGDSFIAARGVLVMLAAAYVFSAGVGSVGYLLSLTGHEIHNARTVVWAVGLDLGLNLALIPFLGIFGAALATVTTYLWVGLRLHYLTTRYVKVDSSILGFGAQKRR